MEAELQKFNKELNDFTKKLVPEKVLTLQKKMVLEALKRLVNKTPVDTGRARGNWQVTISNPAAGQLETTDKEGSGTIARGLAALGGLKPYMVVWITNNLDYIEFLEDGSSTQAPEGMMTVTIQELRTMFRKAA